jgi:osmotically inducible protein OsmC
MADRKATAIWQGDIKNGKGEMNFADYHGQFSFSSRFEEGTGTNPEELLAAAHAGCFSMAFSSALGKAGFVPDKIETTAHIALRQVDGKSKIVSSHLVCKAVVPGILNEEFQKIAEGAKAGCPVSTALAGLEISLDAELV